MIYFDHNATSPYCPSVKEYILTELINDWGNPSSQYFLGHDLFEKIAKIKEYIATFLSCKSKQLFFTGSATESINTVFSIGFFKKNNIKTIITSSLEHHATLNPIKCLEEYGITVKYVPHDKNGELDKNFLETITKENERSFLSFMFVNNESGVVNDVEYISKLARTTNSFLHIDGVQALGKIKINIEKLGVDFMSFSGHKIGALKGVGLLYCKDKDLIAPLIKGGDQEKGIRGGTYNFPAIKSFALAINDIHFKDNRSILKLRDYFEKEMTSQFENVEVNCLNANRIFNTSNLFFKKYESRPLLLMLSESKEKICVSTGSACKAGSAIPSHVITEIYGKERALNSMRLSFSKYNTLSEVKTFIELIKTMI